MAYEIIASQEPVFLYACVAKKRGKTFAVVVLADPELIKDDDYAPGVMKSLMKAWENGDYFFVSAYDAKGEQVQSLGSMAGYGGPEAAAKAFVKDYL
jgi:hypothetical protein